MESDPPGASTMRGWPGRAPGCECGRIEKKDSTTSGVGTGTPTSKS